MAGKVRVYELARELGLTNKETLDLCLSLGIGVKSHSSSMEEAQADRARRKADSQGLRRDAQPTEEVSTSTTKAPVAKATKTSVPKDTKQGSTKKEPVVKEAVAVKKGTGKSTAEMPNAPAKKGTAVKEPTSDKQESAVKEATAKKATTAKKEPVAREEPATAKTAARKSSAKAGIATEESGIEGSTEEAAEIIQVAKRATGKAGTSTTATANKETTKGAETKVAKVSAEQEPASKTPAEVSTGAAETQVAAAETTATKEPAAKAPTKEPAAKASVKESAAKAAKEPAAKSSVKEPAATSTGVGIAKTARTTETASSAGLPGTKEVAGSDDRVQTSRTPTATGRTLSASGKPVPPPPRPPLSASGKPIPPPPGRGNSQSARTPFTRRGDSSGPLGTVEQRSGARTDRTSRPSYTQRSYARPDGTSTAAGGRPIGERSTGERSTGMVNVPTSTTFPPSRPGQRGTGRGQAKRSKRRRRNVEELEPTQLTEYKVSNAPVPEGEIIVERGCTPQELGPKLNRSAGDVVRFMLFQGEMVTATQPLTDEMIELYAMELGAQVKLVDPGQEEETILMARYIGTDEEIPGEDLEPRGPVVTVMGHVDHGKTLLLDRIRSSNVAAGESGGITQHVGAYQVAVGNHLITFIDTPGHEAFTAMRARGAQVTDIVVLVVAADDGVMQQTVEAIDHARSAGVPIIVAINKIDRPEADVNRTMQQLAEHGILPEAWGGDTVVCEISALDGTGINDLLDHIAIVAELEDLKSTSKGRAVAVILEANLDPGKGPVATVIVQRGTLKVGDSVVAGAAWGKVKALVDFLGKSRKSAGPSTPVQVLGFSRPPSAGDTMFVTQDMASAKSMGEAIERRERVTGRMATSVSTGVKLEDIFEQIQSGMRATLNLIVKADGQGTLQAVLDSLEKLEREEVAINFLHKGVGGIAESDVQLAIASNATIIGFNVRPDRRSRELAESRDVDIRTYEVIYKLIEDVESAVVGMLAPEVEENVTGEAEVREVFRVPRVGAVAGCFVRDGVITRGSKVRFLREGVVIWNGSISSLKRFKEDARSVQSGFECGIGLLGYQDLKPGDIIETYEEVPVERK